jgi:hypothetical protein
VQGYSTQISPLLSILSHSSLSFFLALSFFSQACGKYLLKLASNKEIFGGNIGIGSLLGALGSTLEVTCIVVLFEFCL